jgi:hypothetical protein
MTIDASSEPEIEEVAYHEAGHFVARHVLLPHAGFEVITVHAHRHPIGDGFAKTLGDCQEYLDPTEGPEGTQFCETCAIGLYAGYAAQVRYRPSSEERAQLGALWDFEMAEAKIRRICGAAGSGEVVDRACRNLQKAAHLLVEDTWFAIDALAQALILHRTLDGMRARQMVAAGDDEGALSR